MKHKKTQRAHPLTDLAVGCGALMFVLGTMITQMKDRMAVWPILLDCVFLVALIPWTVAALLYVMRGSHASPPGGHPDTDAWKALTVLRMPALPTSKFPPLGSRRFTDEELAAARELIANEKPELLQPLPELVLPLGPERAAAVSEQILELHRTRPEDVYSFLEGETSEQYWTRLCGCDGKNPGGPGHLLMCHLSAVG